MIDRENAESARRLPSRNLLRMQSRQSLRGTRSDWLRASRDRFSERSPWSALTRCQQSARTFELSHRFLQINTILENNIFYLFRQTRWHSFIVYYTLHNLSFSFARFSRRKWLTSLVFPINCHRFNSSTFQSGWSIIKDQQFHKGHTVIKTETVHNNNHIIYDLNPRMSNSNNARDTSGDRWIDRRRAPALRFS